MWRSHVSYVFDAELHLKVNPVMIGPLRDDSGDNPQPAAALPDVWPVLSEVMGADGGPQLCNALP